jgi:Ca2+-binding RTX toxin-like protein
MNNQRNGRFSKLEASGLHWTLAVIVLGAGLLSCSGGHQKSNRTSARDASAEQQSEDAGFSLAYLDHTGLTFNKLDGTAAADTLDGSPGSDLIRGLAGDDKIRGLDGPDFINGNQGNDSVNGNQGNDVVRGGGGDDQLFGGQGDDRIYGDLGNDKISGDLGNDHVFGGVGDDILSGGEGDDAYYFAIGDGNDRIIDSGGGNDRVVCLGFPRGSAEVTLEGSRMTLRFPTGDSLVLEDKGAIESINCPIKGSAIAGPAPQSQQPAVPQQTAEGLRKFIGSEGDGSTMGLAAVDRARASGLSDADIIRMASEQGLTFGDQAVLSLRLNTGKYDLRSYIGPLGTASFLGLAAVDRARQAGLSDFLIVELAKQQGLGFGDPAKQSLGL